MDEEMLSVFYHIYLYYTPTFLSLSLLGNCLSVCVLFCTKLHYNSSSIYLGALAMSDIGVLMTVFINWFQWIEIIPDEYWSNILLTGSQRIFIFLSVWIVVAFTVQRYIVIKWPLLRRSLCTVNRARNIVIGLAGLAVLYSIPWFILDILVITIKSNDIINWTLWLRILIIINFIIIFIIPAIMIAIFNALIVYNMRKQNCIRRNLILISTVSNENTRSSGNETSHIKVAKMLVIISSIFICFNAPFQVLRFCLYYGLQISNKSLLLFNSSILYITNYGINFILYFATGKNFRKELIRMFTKSSDTRRNEDIEMENFKD